MKKIVQSFSLLLTSLILVGFIYGGLTLTQEAKANDNFNQNQQVLSDKIADLEGKIDSQQQTIDDLGIQLANVKKLAAAPKQVLAAMTEPQPTPEPIIKTVTKTVVVKEKPKEKASVTIQGIGSFNIEITNNETAFSLLQKAATENGFTVESTTYEGLGAFVTAIAGIKPEGNQYWAFYYNGQYSMVGASAQAISEGDTTFWRLESF